MPEATLSDEILGTLTWDETYHWYQGKLEVAPAQWIELRLLPDDNTHQADLARARQAFQHIQNQEVALREAAAEALLPRYNENWGDGPPIDRETFAGRITLEGLTVYGDGSAALDYSDGDLFWGHTIVVSLAEDDTVQDVSIEG